MKAFLNKLIHVTKDGTPVVVVSIKASSGSTPRGEGARMIVDRSGIIAGTIGGGAVEYKAIEMAKEVLLSGEDKVHDFVLRNNEVEDIGMICGGEVSVHFKYVGDPKSLSEIVDTIKNEIKYAGTVYIFGGGHVSQALVPVLASVDFNCIVLEDRADFCTESLFRGVEKTILIDVNDAMKDIEVTEDDYICIMTRGHKDDFEIEYQALQTPAKYIGVIGSSKKTAGVNARLKERGVTEEELKRITTPIGIKIHSETPAEIAISIAAQLIEIRGKK